MLSTITRVVFLAAVLACAGRLSGQEKSLDELLNLNLEELASLKVVSAVKVPATVNQVPATVRVITAEEIAEKGCFTLEDALADLPGIQFRNINGFNTYTFMRGVPSQNNKILLLINGIQINELNSGGFYGGLHFNLANVERIEVVYGPASALYGTNAISGVINIILRDPVKEPGGRVTASIGTRNTGSLDFRYAHVSKDKNLAFSISGMGKKSDKTDLRGARGDGNWTDTADNFENDFATDGIVRFKDLSAGFVVQDEDASRASVQVTAHRPLRDYGVNWHIRFFNAWAGYNFENQGPWSFRTTFYYRNTTLLGDTVPIIETATGDSPGRQYRWYKPGELIGNETQATWKPSARFNISAGAVYEREHLSADYSITSSDSEDTRPPAPPEPPRITNGLVSFYAEGDAALVRGLHLFAGVRYDDSSSYGTVNTPRAGLVYNNAGLTAKLLYMEAFRAPKPWDFTDGLGNPALQPEKMHQAEFTASYSFSSYLRADISLYRGKLDGLLTRVPSGGGWMWKNISGIDTQGVETVLEFRKGRWRAYGNYSFTESTDDSGNQIAEIARHGANAGVFCALTPHLSAGILANYLGERTNPALIPARGDDTIEDALILDTNVTLQMPGGFDARFFVNNLFDSSYFHPSNLPPSRYPQAGRTFRIQAGYSF